MRFADMTLADHEAAGARCYSRDEAMERFDIDPPEPTLDELIFDEEYGKWADRVDRDRRVLVDPDDMWIDPRVEELAA